MYEVRVRLLRERLEQMVTRAERDLDDPCWRLALLCLALLERHELDDRGRCRYCRRPGRWCRRASQRCTVLPVVSLYLDQPREFLDTSDN